MAKRLHENWLRSYVEYTHHSESPDVFHFWTGVSVLAGALRRRVWIDQRYFQWTPNFYIVFVAPPGVATKSTTILTGMKLLREVPGINFGPNSVTWQALVKSMEGAQELVAIDGMMYPMSCITCSPGELGTFLKPEEGEMVDVLTDLWDGQLGVWKREIKTDAGTYIENPWINLIGATTPAWIERNFPAYLIGGGLTSRCVFIYGDTKRRLVPYPADAIDTEKFAAAGAKLVEDLILISEMAGEFELTPSATKWGEDWYAKHWATRPEHMASDRYSGYIARKQTHMHKLAIILSAAESSNYKITEDHLATSDRIITPLESDMAKVFQSIGVGEAPRYMKEVVQLVKAYGKVSQLELWRMCSSTMARNDFEEACKGASAASFIMQKVEGGKAIFQAL